MKKSLLALMVGLMVLVIGCDINYQTERTVEAKLLSVSIPHISQYQFMIVRLVWAEKQSATNRFENDGDGILGGGYQIWNAFPVEKVPSDILGRHIDKRVRLTYKIINDDRLMPLIYVVKFEVLE